MRLFCLSALAALLVACSESPRESLDAARQALAGSRYGDAVEAADAGLGASPDDLTRWGLELVKLEALAREGLGEETLAQLEKLAGSHPEQVSAGQYSATAGQLRAAGQGPAAIRVLDLGLKRFPEDATLLDLIEQAKAAPAPGSDELEMLRSLGYVE